MTHLLNIPLFLSLRFFRLRKLVIFPCYQLIQLTIIFFFRDRLSKCFPIIFEFFSPSFAVFHDFFRWSFAEIRNFSMIVDEILKLFHVYLPKFAIFYNRLSKFTIVSRNSRFFRRSLAEISSFFRRSFSEIRNFSAFICQNSRFFSAIMTKCAIFFHDCLSKFVVFSAKVSKIRDFYSDHLSQFTIFFRLSKFAFFAIVC